MNNFLHVVEQALGAAAGMFWQILWAMIFGYALSGIVIVFIPKRKMVALLGKAGPQEIALATFFGSVSSSCSFAAAAMARSLFQKGAHIIPALAFMLASTNLVIELSAVLWLMMGWEFVVGEFVGGLILIALMSLLMKLFVSEDLFKIKPMPQSKHHGHDVPQEQKGPFTTDGWIHVGKSFVSEWRMTGRDIILGILISGFIMVIVPNSFWQALFLTNHGPESAGGFFVSIRQLENVLVGPLISMFSFVCSIGNIPLAGVLYRGGMTFGGTLSFIYADLIIIPLILIYKKYYGGRAAVVMTGVFYVSMVLTGLIVQYLFGFFKISPHTPTLMTTNHEGFFAWNYTTWLNFGAIIVAFILIWFSKKSDPDEKEVDSCCH